MNKRGFAYTIINNAGCNNLYSAKRKTILIVLAILSRGLSYNW